jgi:hypothetical protein
MNISDSIFCSQFPCSDVNHDGYVIADLDLDPHSISMMMISETAPQDSRDYYYADGEAAYEATTLMAFRDAGFNFDSFDGLTSKGIYLTSAVKCAKTGYGIKAATIKECSTILENEIGLFPNLKVIMLMGDVAIKAINYIAIRSGAGRVIPTGSTYKIRTGKFFFGDIRLFPSYLQVGPSFGIEKSKLRMIADDISRGMAILD